MKKILSIGIISFTLISCSDAQEKMYEKLNEEVMALHDHIMPKTETIVSLQSKLDSLAKGPDSVHVKKLKAALSKADASMMDWMHHYSLDSLEKMSIKDKISYLSGQISQLQTIEKLTDSTLAAAKNYVK